jgi:ectoine hydroxylase-related dioxygenase (phytanoyl-CoA dioxygenase family)
MTFTDYGHTLYLPTDEDNPTREILTDGQISDFQTNGFLVLEKFIKPELIDVHMSNPKRNHSERVDHTKDYSVLNILCGDDVQEVLKQLNYAVALHSAVTYETSSEKPWHQDVVLTSKFGGAQYVGVWVACEDISEDSGPFQLIAGSHKWDIDYGHVYDFPEEELAVGSQKRIELEVDKRKVNSEVFKFHAKKGDIIIWHGQLFHSGGTPGSANATRKSLTGHYCNAYSNNRQNENPPEIDFILKEMGSLTHMYARNNNGGYYFL